MSYAEQVKTTPADGIGVDAFGRVRVSNPTTLFDSTFLYDKQPLIFEEIITGGATATYDSDNSSVVMSTTGVDSEEAILESYLRTRYQPGKSHLIQMTFTFGTGVAGVIKEVGLNSSTNGFVFRQDGTTLSFQRKSSSGAGDLNVTQSNWNIDKLDGTGPSGVTLDITKTQILVMDMQWLGVGRVRMGFSINGEVYIAHEFYHANNESVPYTESMVLPVRWRIASTDASSSMRAVCSSVQSEGGTFERYGLGFSQGGSVIAASDTRTHLISIRPKLTVNGKTNRIEYQLLDLSILVVGQNSIKWELCIGANLTGTTTFNDVNANYSSVEYNTEATFSDLTGGAVIASGFVAATSNSKNVIARDLSVYYPLSLDSAGNHRDLGTITLLVSGIGGTSDTQAALQWSEKR